MRIDSTSVALLKCPFYNRHQIIRKIDQLCSALGFGVNIGTKVLLKPNLLTGRSTGHLACTHPEFVAAAAEWFVNKGAIVTIGDSPGFGTAVGVMRGTGIDEALAGLPVQRLNFDLSSPVTLSGGVSVNIARAALECDLLVNLPRVKVHDQLYMTLAVKNYFGTVVGLQKPWWHLRYGDHVKQFAAHLVDLLAVLPAGLTLLDGIVAMHGSGPVTGRPYSLGLVAGGINPVAIDTALLHVLKLDPAQSPLWRECADRGLAGVNPAMLQYPILRPVAFSAIGFETPAFIKSISFNPLRMMVSTCRRLTARVKESP